MSETGIVAPPNTPIAPKSKIERTHHWLSVVSTSIGIAGAVGATFVWLAANLYVGDVEIKSDKPLKGLSVNVYNKKGRETTYHWSQFQLMPGKYHLQITPEGGPTQQADIEVKFGARSEVSVVAGENRIDPNLLTEAEKHHWWQFWRR